MPVTESFGSFLRTKRKEREITVRAMAEMVGLSSGAYCDVESSRIYPPGIETLEKILGVLRLPDEERKLFFDLAGKARSQTPPDLPDYINENQVVRVALRVAKEKASDDDWRRFISELERKE
jgi:transcriptional regulator with XRE-family HTH domain